MIRIDAMGDACPIPVIKTKRALEGATNHNETLHIVVDNEIATQNLGKMASNMGLSYSIEQHGIAQYTVIITKGEGSIVPAALSKTDSSVVVIGSDTMGNGDQVLGKSLLKAFIYTLTELPLPPQAVIFYNSGAFLTTKDSNALGDLRDLEKKGTRILTCGACLNFYSLELPAVGDVTNMLEMVELMGAANSLLRP